MKNKASFLSGAFMFVILFMTFSTGISSQNLKVTPFNEKVSRLPIESQRLVGEWSKYRLSKINDQKLLQVIGK